MANYKMGPIVSHSMQMFVLYLTEKHAQQIQILGEKRNFVITFEVHIPASKKEVHIHNTIYYLLWTFSPPSLN